MRALTPRIFLFAAATSALSMLACGPAKVAPPVPRATSTWVDSLPPVPPSFIDVPVRYDLAPGLKWLEAQIPLEFGDINDPQPVREKKRMTYAYSAKRTPFHLSINGRHAVLQADIDYEAKAWYDLPVLPKISGSCGGSGERPRARLSIDSDVELTSDWRLRPHSVAKAEPITGSNRDKCKVTFLSVDVTKKVMSAAQDALQKRLAEFDTEIAAFDLPGESKRIWKILQTPQKLTDSLWLVMDPSAVRVGLLAMRHDTLVTAVGLSAHPRVVGGARPEAAVRPLPAPKDSSSRPPVLHLLSEGRLPYDVASTILSRELRGDTIHVAGQKLIVDSLQVLGVGDGRAAVGLDVSGPVDGVLYMVGHPAYDTATAELYMPDLEYDVGTRDLLTGALSWLAGSNVEDFLRNKVRIKMDKVIADGRELLEMGLNRDLAEGVHLNVDITSAKGLGVRAAPDAILLRVVATGQGELVLDMKPQRLLASESLGAAATEDRAAGAGSSAARQKRASAPPAKRQPCETPSRLQGRGRDCN